MGKLAFFRRTGERRGTNREAAPWELSEKPLPGIWRLVLGSVVLMVLMASVSLYGFLQLRQVTTLSLELVSDRYPAIESAKWLLTSLYTQLTNEKKYLVTRDPWFLMEFNEEAEEFRRTLTTLQNQEHSPDGRKFLDEAEQLYTDYRDFFRTHVNRQAGPSFREAAAYERKRDVAIALIEHRLQDYVGLQETWVSNGVTDVRARTAQAFTQLTIAALLLALGMAGVVYFSVLYLLRYRQDLRARFSSGSMDTAEESQASPRLA
jgi:two-component system, NtrC family, sensor histidine kinase GlrK